MNFSGCNGGQLIGESIVLHVALRCSRLRLVDASWSNVGDNGVEALVQNVDRFVVYNVTNGAFCFLSIKFTLFLY